MNEHVPIGGGADKYLARPGRKEATLTKLWIYSTYSPRSSIHFLARCSNFCKSSQIKELVRRTRSPRQQPPLRTKSGELSICFFQSRKQVAVRRDQIRRIVLVIKTMGAQVSEFLLGCKCPVSWSIVCHARTRPSWWTSRGVFPSKCPSVAPTEMSNNRRC